MITQNHLQVLIGVLNRMPASLAEQMIVGAIIEELSAGVEAAAPQEQPQQPPTRRPRRRKAADHTP